MNYSSGIARVLAWLEDREEVGVVASSPVFGDPLVTIAVHGTRLVWEPVDPEPGRTPSWFADADAVAGREVSPASFEAFIEQAITTFEEDE